jgi:4-deoxy-L-threo-5-hexosulose-uronate ketol-isomerase
MEVRFASSPEAVKAMDTQQLRKEFLIQGLFEPDSIRLVYSHVDRIITGGVQPQTKALALDGEGEALHAAYFLERRELGVINIGGPGKVTADRKEYPLRHRDGMYIGRGSRGVTFTSDEEGNPALFYLNSAPAHRECLTVLIRPEDCQNVELGTLETSNHRVITKYILTGQVESCQLVMGMTTLKPGSVWNTMPCHTHERRMEVYLYFDLKEDALAMHYMGRPNETRHIVMRNREAVISPSWSIHSASGTRAYTFIWGMAGENQAFDDMDPVAMSDIL